MIKKGARFKNFTPLQRAQLEAVGEKEGLKTATEVFLFVLDKHQDLVNQLSRMERFNTSKTAKINELKENLEKHGIE